MLLVITNLSLDMKKKVTARQSEEKTKVISYNLNIPKRKISKIIRQFQV